LGAPFEGGVLERMLWRLIGKTRSGQLRWTDDTQMSLDLMESLIEKGTVDPDDLASRFAASYRWSRGYGPATAKVLKRIATGVPWEKASRSVYADGSFGNGAAMRAPVIGLFFANRPHQLDEAARGSAIVTHAHPSGIEGALVIARATAAALRQESSDAIVESVSECCVSDPSRTRLTIAQGWLSSGADVHPRDVAHRLGNGIAASESCVTALYLALRFREADFIEMQQMVAAIRGDADTIGAMAGAIWGAGNGYSRLPVELLKKLEQGERLSTHAAALHQRAIEFLR
jgi:ADP-ribosylglycohydrolase